MANMPQLSPYGCPQPDAYGQAALLHERFASTGDCVTEESIRTGLKALAS